MDPRATLAREYHRGAIREVELAREYRAARDQLVCRLRAEDPQTWTYAALAKAVGCSPELIAHICKRDGAASRLG